MAKKRLKTPSLGKQTPFDVNEAIEEILNPELPHFVRALRLYVFTVAITNCGGSRFKNGDPNCFQIMVSSRLLNSAFHQGGLLLLEHIAPEDPNEDLPFNALGNWLSLAFLIFGNRNSVHRSRYSLHPNVIDAINLQSRRRLRDFSKIIELSLRHNVTKPISKCGSTNAIRAIFTDIQESGIKSHYKMILSESLMRQTSAQVRIISAFIYLIYRRNKLLPLMPHRLDSNFASQLLKLSANINRLATFVGYYEEVRERLQDRNYPCPKLRGNYPRRGPALEYEPLPESLLL